MEGIKKTTGVLKSSFRRIIREPRFYVAYLWFMLLSSALLMAIRSLCVSTGISVSPWLLPFLTTESGNQMFVIIGALILFCDAPFLNGTSGWQILRSGRKSWYWGNMIYIWLLSLIYAVGLALIPVIMMLPHVEWADGWGKILGTLAQTSAAAQLGITNLNYSIMTRYEPIQAMAFLIFIIWLNAVLIGMINYVFNLYVKQGTGTIISAVIGLSPLMLVRLANYRIAYYISPPLWMDLSVYRYRDYGAGPTFAYAMGILLGLIVLCMVISYIGVRKKDLNMVEEV